MRTKNGVRGVRKETGARSPRFRATVAERDDEEVPPEQQDADDAGSEETGSIWNRFSAAATTAASVFGPTKTEEATAEKAYAQAAEVSTTQTTPGEAATKDTSKVSGATVDSDAATTTTTAPTWIPDHLVLSRKSLHGASFRGDKKIVMKCLKGGADVNGRSTHGYAALHLASMNGHKETVRVLLSFKADTNATARNGYTPLHYAAEKDRVKVARLLLTPVYNAMPDVADKGGYTPLHYAAKNDYMEMAQLLLDSDAAVDARDNRGYTPLHCAAEKGFAETASFLLNRGARVSAVTKDGDSALYLAAVGGHFDTAEMLMGRGGWNTTPPSTDHNDWAVHQMMRKRLWRQAVQDAQDMRPSTMKQYLQQHKRTMDGYTFVEKHELVEAYAETMVEVRTQDGAVEQMVQALVKREESVRKQTCLDKLTRDQAKLKDRKERKFYADMPQLVPALDPPSFGLWLLAPYKNHPMANSDANIEPEQQLVTLQYVWRDHTDVVIIQRGHFPIGSTLLSGNQQDGLVWVKMPVCQNEDAPIDGLSKTAVDALSKASAKKHAWCIQCVNQNTPGSLRAYTGHLTYYLPDTVRDVVYDGRGALYVLETTDATRAQALLCLKRYTHQAPGGALVTACPIPYKSRMMRHGNRGVWIHVLQEAYGRKRGPLTPGLWFLSPEKVQCVLTNVPDFSKFGQDSKRTGLLLLLPGGEWFDKRRSYTPVSTLLHLGPDGILHQQSVPVAFGKVKSVLDDGNRGALVHCQIDGGWKLCRTSWSKPKSPSEMTLMQAADGSIDALEAATARKRTTRRRLMKIICDCPNRTNLVTRPSCGRHGTGGVWLMKKVGKSNKRTMLFVNTNVPPGYPTHLAGTEERFTGDVILEV